MKNKTHSGGHIAVPAVIDPIPFPDEIAHLAMINELYEIQLVSPDSTSFANGISVTSIQMAIRYLNSNG